MEKEENNKNIEGLWFIGGFNPNKTTGEIEYTERVYEDRGEVHHYIHNLPFNDVGNMVRELTEYFLQQYNYPLNYNN